MANMLDTIRSSVNKALKGKLDKGIFHTVRLDPAGGLDELGDAASTKVIEYSCEGFIAEYSDHARAVIGVPETSYKVCILSNSMSAIPIRNDEAKFRGKWSRLLRVAKDPATALWICEAHEIQEPTIGC